jgi:hypothetical protein
MFGFLAFLTTDLKFFNDVDKLGKLLTEKTQTAENCICFPLFVFLVFSVYSLIISLLSSPLSH